MERRGKDAPKCKEDRSDQQAHEPTVNKCRCRPSNLEYRSNHEPVDWQQQSANKPRSPRSCAQRKELVPSWPVRTANDPLGEAQKPALVGECNGGRQGYQQNQPRDRERIGKSVHSAGVADSDPTGPLHDLRRCYRNEQKNSPVEPLHSQPKGLLRAIALDALPVDQ